MAATAEATDRRIAVLSLLVAVLYCVVLLDLYLTLHLVYPNSSNLRSACDLAVQKDSEDVENIAEGSDAAYADEAPGPFPHQPVTVPSGSPVPNSNNRKADEYVENRRPFDFSTLEINNYESNSNFEEGDDNLGTTERILTRNKRKSTYRRTRQYHPSPDDSGVPSVEFFPRPQPTHETNGYVWLTSYSRIPVEVLKEFCFSTKEHCPPGATGPPGIPGTPGFKGDRGDRGDRGLPGEPGPRGPQGFIGLTGPVGPKGESGKSGIPGLDGRDGIPGEPGLDGVPGRDGIDGIPGRDGIPGIPGTPGRPGTNGTNGIPGSPGPRGPPGPTGPPGLPGPRGRKGIPGKPGTPGVPGIKAWTINGTESQPLLIPPSIIDTEQQTTLLVDEGHDVQLKCAATGQPAPQIKWRSDENKPIYLRSWQQSSVQDDVLEIRRVSRDHMGIYMCIASNGVPPPAYMKVKLEVGFPPLIKIRNQNIATMNGSYALLECFIEAHPPAVNFWLHEDNRMVEPSWKFKMSQKDNGYRTRMILNITYIEPLDYGRYQCVSKNDKGKTLGVFNVFETDPNIPTRKPPLESTYEIYGQPPPPPPPYEASNCEPCTTKCDPPPFCPTAGSPDISKVHSVLIPNMSYLTPPRVRRDNCMIHQLGKPVFQRFSKQEQGAWYQDSMPLPENENKYYVTLMNDTNHLYEYANREDFRNGNHSVKHDLHYDFVGNAHVVYNGSFYFHKSRNHVIIRFDIAKNSSSGGDVEDVVLIRDRYLYNTDLSYMDITADENGLWVIYSSIYSNNTIVRKLDPYTLETKFIWNITLPHRSVGDMFICCGVLYAVNSVTVPNTKITFAFDLYQNKLLEVNIDFSNPFRGNSMITYNPKHRKVFTWDKGNQLVYPILFGTIDMGQPENFEPEQKEESRIKK